MKKFSGGIPSRYCSTPSGIDALIFFLSQFPALLFSEAFEGKVLPEFGFVIPEVRYDLLGLDIDAVSAYLQPFLIWQFMSHPLRFSHLITSVRCGVGVAFEWSDECNLVSQDLSNRIYVQDLVEDRPFARRHSLRREAYLLFQSLDRPLLYLIGPNIPFWFQVSLSCVTFMVTGTSLLTSFANIPPHLEQNP